MVGRQAAAETVGEGAVPVIAVGAVDVGVAGAMPVVALLAGESDESAGEQAASVAMAARAVKRMMVRRSGVPPGRWVVAVGRSLHHANGAGEWCGDGGGWTPVDQSAKRTTVLVLPQRSSRR